MCMPMPLSIQAAPSWCTHVRQCLSHTCCTSVCVRERKWHTCVHHCVAHMFATFSLTHTHSYTHTFSLSFSRSLSHTHIHRCSNSHEVATCVADRC